MGVSNVVAADRYSYISTMPFVVLIAAALGRSWAIPRRTQAWAFATAGVALAAIGALVLLTRGQCLVWRNPESLWTHALEHGGDSSTVRSAVGLKLLRQGELAEAADHLLEAVRLDPENPRAQYNLGLLLAERGDLTAAAGH
jgi:hypothetical protein